MQTQTTLPKGMRWRGEAIHVSVMVKGKRLTATVPDGNVDAAKAKKAELENQLRNHATTDGEGVVRWTLKKAYETTYSAEWRGQRSEATAVGNCQYAIDFFGEDEYLDQITTARLDDFVIHLTSLGNSDATINRKLGSISKMMTVAMDRGGLARKPKFPRRKEQAGRIRFFTKEEEAAILDCAKQMGWDEFVDVVIVALDTGMRRAEILKLQPLDLDFKQNVVNIWNTKTNRPRSVPMTTRVKDILKSRAKQPKLWTLGRAKLRWQWDRVKGIIGFGEDEQFVFHTCRHTCASRLVQGGVPIAVVQEWMGHTVIQTTMRYAHLAPQSLKAHLNVLESP